MPENESERREPWMLEDLEQRAEAIREKEARGEELTTEEAGVLGALASIRSTNREREEAERAGRTEEFQEEHRVRSWMRGEETRAPTLGEEDEAREGEGT